MDHETTRSVLVTGASSGIGNCVARYLAERGHLVYGTVRSDGTADELASAAGAAASEESEMNRKPSSLETVAIAVYDALFSPGPKLHYLVGTRWEGDRVLNALVAKLLDENDNPQHNYSREQLAALLDRHITERART